MNILFYFNILNKATRTRFYWSMTLLFSQVSCYVRYKGIYRQSLFRWSIFIYTRDCRFSLRKSPVKLDTSQNYLPFLYTAPIYKNIYTEYPSDIETDYTKKIVDIKNFTSYFYLFQNSSNFAVQVFWSFFYQ